MGSVNNAKAYMGFGYTENQPGDPNIPIITDPTFQGGIVSAYYFGCLWGALFGGLGWKEDRPRKDHCSWLCLGCPRSFATVLGTEPQLDDMR